MNALLGQPEAFRHTASLTIAFLFASTDNSALESRFDLPKRPPS